MADHNTPIKAVDLEKMCQAVAHRGPNQQGVRLWPKAGLGFRRLSIIDLSDAANQPMANENESLWLVFNGEVYNFRELRKQLEQSGHAFRSHSDSEVVLHAFEEWGADCLHRFEGMFAFAIYRPEDHYLFIARDPFGIKPLYYYTDRQQLIFSSEIRALLSLNEISAELHHDVLLPYFTLGYVPGTDSMFRNIRKLAGGHYLEIKDGRSTTHCYWDLAKVTENKATTSAKQLEAAMRLSVERSMISDVPLGVFLSGGLDSSLLSMIAQDFSKKPLHTFSIGFSDQPDFDESVSSQYVSSLLGTEHHQLMIESKALDALGDAIEAIEEPLADPSIIPTYHLAALTKQHVTVSLAGEGGDELFAGYNRYYWESRSRGMMGSVAAAMAPLALPLLKILPTRNKRGIQNLVRRASKFMSTSHLPVAQRYLAWFSLLPLNTRNELLKNGSSDQDPLEMFKHLFLQAKSLSHLQKLQYVDSATMLTSNLLLKADKLGMRHSLEVRVPFLNRPLAETIFCLSDKDKIDGKTLKHAERQLLMQRFDPKWVQQPKRGFEVPFGNWLRQHPQHPLHDLFQESPSYLDSKAVASIYQQHMQGHRDFGLALFAIAVLKIWQEKFSVSVS